MEITFVFIDQVFKLLVHLISMRLSLFSEFKVLVSHHCCNLQLSLKCVDLFSVWTMFQQSTLTFIPFDRSKVFIPIQIVCCSELLFHGAWRLLLELNWTDSKVSFFWRDRRLFYAHAWSIWTPTCYWGQWRTSFSKSRHWRILCVERL